MMEQNRITQLHSISPDDLTRQIINGIESKLANFKDELNSVKREIYLTRIETTEMLNISLTCLNDWSKKGILKPLKMGNRTYFKLSEIEAKLNNSNTL